MREVVAEVNPDALFCDGFDEAIIGTAERFGFPSPVVAYDYDKVIKLLVAAGCASEEQAVEYFEFNVVGAWMGDNTPVFIRRLSAPKPKTKSKKSSS